MRSSRRIGHYLDGTKMEISYELYNKLMQWPKVDKASLDVLDELEIQDKSRNNGVSHFCGRIILFGFSKYKSLVKEKSLYFDYFLNYICIKIIVGYLLPNFCICTEIQRHKYISYFSFRWIINGFCGRRIKTYNL